MSRRACDEIRPLLPAHLDGELDPAAAARVRDHLDACPDCRQHYEALRLAVEALRRLPELPPPASILAGVRERLHPVPWHRRVFARRPWLVGVPVGALATALVVIGVALFQARYPQLPRVAGDRAPAPPAVPREVPQTAPPPQVPPAADRAGSPEARRAPAAQPAPGPAVGTAFRSAQPPVSPTLPAAPARPETPGGRRDAGVPRRVPAPQPPDSRKVTAPPESPAPAPVPRPAPLTASAPELKPAAPEAVPTPAAPAAPAPAPPPPHAVRRFTPTRPETPGSLGEAAPAAPFASADSPPQPPVRRQESAPAPRRFAQPQPAPEPGLEIAGARTGRVPQERGAPYPLTPSRDFTGAAPRGGGSIPSAIPAPGAPAAEGFGGMPGSAGLRGAPPPPIPSTGLRTAGAPRPAPETRAQVPTQPPETLEALTVLLGEAEGLDALRQLVLQHGGRTLATRVLAPRELRAAFAPHRPRAGSRREVYRGWELTVRIPPRAVAAFADALERGPGRIVLERRTAPPSPRGLQAGEKGLRITVLR